MRQGQVSDLRHLWETPAGEETGRVRGFAGARAGGAAVALGAAAGSSGGRGRTGGGAAPAGDGGFRGQDRPCGCGNFEGAPSPGGGAKGGGYIGVVKVNRPELKRAPEEWLQLRRVAGAYRPADRHAVEKGHGRITAWPLWQTKCDAEMPQYRHAHLGWPGVQWCGWPVRRQWRDGRREEERHMWVGGVAFAWELRAEQVAAYLCRHWTIENGVFYVRDVTMDEDRLTGRKIGGVLSGIRDVALNLLHRLGTTDTRMRGGALRHCLTSAYTSFGRIIEKP